MEDEGKTGTGQVLPSGHSVRFKLAATGGQLVVVKHLVRELEDSWMGAEVTH
eukprot:CAMPEP_0194344448 /NCGR_PEP_ID=MMETSP0171-20130528/101497_1 /TAXON_ID=218684 /ORGANISM="Corethron pennatum, Strain L29A3" /LENGTH=51 /DNA_ID=CAMNT_0039111117 /DNA_START=44 /DNA_END=199 /DNA_ORIENTATION=-